MTSTMVSDAAAAVVAQPAQENAAIPVEMVEDEDNNDDDDDVFSRQIRKRNRIQRSAMSYPHRSKALHSRKSKAKRLKIVLKTFTVATPPEGPDKSSCVADETASQALPRSDVADPADLILEEWNRECLVEESDDDEEIQAEIERQLEDSLSFFQETHEEQLPSYAAFQKQLAEWERQKRLQELEEQDRKGRREIEELIAQLCKEKQASTDRSLEKYRDRAVSDEKQTTQRLMHMYRQKTASNQQKINDGVKVLEQRHQKEMQQMNHNYQIRANQRRLTEAMASQEWHSASQQMQAKHQRQLQAFHLKGDELKKKTETEFQREKEKIRKQVQLKQQEIESSRQKLFAKVLVQFQQARQRYLRRHLQKIMKEKEALLRPDPELVEDESPSGEQNSGSPHRRGSDAISVNPQEMAKSTMDRAELNPPAPILSAEPWAADLPIFSGASQRHKHRKGVMGQTIRQLSLEIHNEGIWITSIADTSNNTNGNDDKTKKTGENNGSTGENHPSGEYEFVPWGHKAHNILNTVVCGEFPTGYERILEDHPQAAELMQVQGSQVRCVITDLRSSAETATTQRAIAFKKQDDDLIQALENNVMKLNLQVAECEKATKALESHEQNQTNQVKITADEVQNAMRIQEEFKNNLKHYLTPEGNPLPDANPNDQRELQKAVLKYKTNLDNAAQKAKLAKQALAETKAKRERLEIMVKSAQKNLLQATNSLKKKRTLAADEARGKVTKQSEAAAVEKAATRVTDTIRALQLTAEHRRQLYEKKKSSSLSSAWVQSFPGLPSSVKKSIWHRLHRRKQQIILRPTEESMIVELRASVARALASKFSGRSAEEKAAALEDEMLRAEQRFLLVTHPLGDANISKIPPAASAEDWAEPGWHLNLEVPEESNEFCILPCVPYFPILERNLAEIASAPGRQAASMLRESHLRCLAFPMSVFSVASAPAEENASFTQTLEYADGDPLHVTEEEMELGYTFTLKPPPAKPSAPRRKSATAKSTSQAAAPAPAALDEPVSSKHEKTTATVGKSQKSEPKKRRSSLSKTNTGAVAQANRLVAATQSTLTASQAPYGQVHLPGQQQQAQHQAQLQQQQQQQQNQVKKQQQLQQAQQQQLQVQQHYQHAQQQHMRMQSPPAINQQQAVLQGIPPQSQHMRHPNSQQPHHYSPPHRSSDPYYQQRMMQHQQIPSPRHHTQQMNPSYAQFQQLQQFYPPLPTHPIHIQPPPLLPNNPHQQPNVQVGMPQGPSGQQQQQQQQRTQGNRDPNNDPLFMLGNQQ